MAEQVVHKAPSVQDDTFPCCGAPLDMKARVSYLDAEVTCTGKRATNIDDLLRERLAEALGARVGLVEIPQATGGNPPHGMPGHQCLPDDVMLDISNTLEKIAELAKIQRERLIEKGFEESTAQGLAAHLHASLVKTILG